MGFLAFLKSKFTKKKAVIGLALGSGGAKGFAHLGALKAFEENGIEFDVIGGTSIGSIVGAFYADGYSSTDIYGLISGLNLKDMLNGIPFNMDMSGIKKVLDRQIGGKNIEDLKKPMVVVATDADEMKEVVFTKGNVATALCGSSCYAPFFRPVVDTEGRRLIDGAYMNAIPADRVAELGADYIVGIDLSAFKEPTPIEKKRPGSAENSSFQGYEYSDVMLTPDLTAYKAIAYNKRNEMYELGYQSAMAKMEQIKADYLLLRAGKKPKSKKTLI